MVVELAGEGSRALERFERVAAARPTRGSSAPKIVRVLPSTRTRTRSAAEAAAARASASATAERSERVGEARILLPRGVRLRRAAGLLTRGPLSAAFPARRPVASGGEHLPSQRRDRPGLAPGSLSARLCAARAYHCAVTEARRAAWWLPVVLWAALIFALSSIPSLGTGLGAGTSCCASSRTLPSTRCSARCSRARSAVSSPRRARHRSTPSPTRCTSTSCPAGTRRCSTWRSTPRASAGSSAVYAVIARRATAVRGRPRDRPRRRARRHAPLWEALARGRRAAAGLDRARARALPETAPPPPGARPLGGCGGRRLARACSSGSPRTTRPSTCGPTRRRAPPCAGCKPPAYGSGPSPTRRSRSPASRSPTSARRDGSTRSRRVTARSSGCSAGWARTASSSLARGAAAACS